MKDNFVKYARTFTPAVAGGVLMGLTNAGIEMDSEALTIVVDGLIVGGASMLYYGAVNLLSKINPQVQILNGAKAVPNYEVQERN